MDKIISKILKTIEDNGYTCYLVGGYVRDTILGLPCTDIDITTSAPIDKIKKIFKVDKDSSYGSINFTIDIYTFEITTYRIEGAYEARKPKTVEYTSDILEDLKRRDFTINAILMDSKGDIYDPLNGQRDLQNRMIVAIGDIEKKLREDPLRILRALRFSITRGFNLDSRLLKFIKDNTSLLSTLSYKRRKDELDKIFDHAERGDIEFLDEMGIFDALEVRLTGNAYVKSDNMGSWAQFDFNKEYPFNKKERKTIESIKSILSHKNIDNFSLFEFGKYANTTAAKILGIPLDDILNMYEKLPIKSSKDLCISSDKILNITSCKKEMLGVIKKDLLNIIIRGNLPNRGMDIERYLVEKWK